MKRNLMILAFGSALLAACGSDDKDSGASLAQAREPAILDSAEDAAKLAAYIRLLAEVDDAADARELDQEFRGNGAKAVMKFRLEDSCEKSGNFAIYDNNDPDMLTLEFNRCVNNLDETLDGKAVLKCEAGSFQDDSCSNVLITYADGGLTYSDAEDRAALSGTWRVITSSTSLRVEQSLEVTATDGSADVRAAAVTQNFFKDLEQDGNGAGLASIGGSAGGSFSGPAADCASGMVTFTTREPVQVESSGSLVGGRVTVSNGQGDSADVAFSADGSVTVTFEGATESFSRSRFERFCELALD